MMNPKVRAIITGATGMAGVGVLHKWFFFLGVSSEGLNDDEYYRISFTWSSPITFIPWL